MKKKWIIVGSVAGVIVILTVAGLVIRSKSSVKVPVVSVESMSGWFGGDYGGTLSGTITSDATQRVYKRNDDVVKEIFVKDGQIVHAGDKLVEYDVSLQNLELEMKKLEVEQLNLNIQKAEREINKVNTAKPETESEPEVEEPVTEEPQVEEPPVEKPDPEQPEVVVDAETLLTDQTAAYLGSGKAEDPYHFLLSTEGIIAGTFFDKMAQEKAFFIIEVRENNKSNGKVMTMWGQQLSPETLTTDASKQYVLKLQKNDNIDFSQVAVSNELSEQSQELFYKGDGSQSDPYTYVLSENGTVRGTFFLKMKEKNAWFRIEVWKDNVCGDILSYAWEQSGSLLGDDILPEDTFVVKQPQKEESTEPVEPTEPIEPTEPTEPENSAEGNTQTGVRTNVKVRLLSSQMNTEQQTSVNEKQKQLNELNKQIKEYQLNLKETNLEIQQMERELSRQIVKSSLDGVVKMSEESSDGQSTDGMILQVAGSEGMFVKGVINENQLGTLKPGTLLSGTSYESGVTFTAEIKDVSPYPSSETSGNNGSSYPFTAYIENAEGLSNNMMVDLTPQNNDGDMSANIMLEKMFVRFEAGEYYVLKADDKNRLVKQPVSIAGIKYGNLYDIKDGLTMQDRIAFPYGKKAVEGAVVEDGTMEDLYR